MGLFTGEFLSLLFMAQALGLDAFSICLGFGMQKMRLRRIAWIGLVIGIFHIFMPLLGILIGSLLFDQIESYANLFGGIILLLIGLQMFFGAFASNNKTGFQPIGIGLIIIAFTVSLDSFSVGLSLGLSGVQTTLALILFGTMSAILSWVALLLSRHVHIFLGKYSELLGGSILCGFGLQMVF